jgi:hypothetical protein
MISLGPSAPFVGIATLGMVGAGLAVAIMLLSCHGKNKWKQINSRYNSVVVLLLMATTFLLWGSSTGHGGPHSNGGMIGYTHGGLLHYVSAVSHQPRAGVPWSHDLSVRPLALLGTLALNAAAVIVAVFGGQWMSRRMPNNRLQRSGGGGRLLDG